MLVPQFILWLCLRETNDMDFEFSRPIQRCLLDDEFWSGSNYQSIELAVLFADTIQYRTFMLRGLLGIRIGYFVCSIRLFDIQANTIAHYCILLFHVCFQCGNRFD